MILVYIYIYIYVCVCVCVCVCVLQHYIVVTISLGGFGAKQMRYNLESAECL